MMRRIIRFLLTVAGLVLLAGACLAFAMYRDWPWWTAILLFVGILAAIAMARAGWQAWMTWRLKRRLAMAMTPEARRADHTAFDRQWQAGLAVLRQSRYVGQTVSARRLPWILALDLHDIPSNAFTRLAVKSIVGQPDAQAAPPTIGWHFLRHSVLLHAGRDLLLQDADKPDSSWQRLLYSLNRLRRHEPLNGIALRVDTARLIQDDGTSLAELGRTVRTRLDELARVMDARMPVWILITGAQALPGLREWAMELEDDLRHAAFGATLPQLRMDQPISDRVRLLFSSIEARLFELRVAQGMHGALDPAVFEFSLQVQGLQDPLQRLLAPAFDASPYAPAPLLQGLYLTAQGSEDKQWVPWFSQALYDDILPAQRDAWMPLEHWRQSRRLVRRTAVVGWLALCGLCAVSLLYSWRQVQNEIHTLEKRPLQELNFEGNLENDLQALHVWRDATVQLLNAGQGLHSRLPLMNHLGRLHARYREEFAQIYRREILAKEMDPLLTDVLPQAAQRGRDVELAAWAQYLVRRINLIQARLDARPLDGLPLPGSELREISVAAGRPAPGAQAALLTGKLYQDYLMWQPQEALLRSEQDSLRAALLQLGLDVRPPTWLLAWANLQYDLQPITLSDFWMTPEDPTAPHIPAGLTPAGTQAIRRFVEELAGATGNSHGWKDQDAELARRFRQASADAWYRFADHLPDARRQLPDEASWRNQVANTMTRHDPHLAVMRQIAQLFSDFPENERPDWASHIIELDRLFAAAQVADDSRGSLVDKAKLAGTLGGAQLRGLVAGTSLGQSAEELGRGLDAAADLQEYRREVMLAAAQSLQGNTGSMKLAIDTWGFGHDPSIQVGPLHKGKRVLDALRQRLGTDEVGDGVVWDLLRGPLQLTQDYAARAAACQLQSRWDSDVLGAVQGVGNAGLADELLYGDRGQVGAFLQGDVRHFVDRDAARYRPREALGMTIPLNGQFYAFASTAQQHSVRRLQAARDQPFNQKKQQLEEQTLLEQVTELEKQQAQLRSREARLRITGEPSLVNPGARILPQKIRLTLQCTDGATILDNFNFPVSKTFTWSAQGCAETTLEIHFKDMVLHKVYPGLYGFPDFVATFANGQKTFTPADFPDQAKLMQSHGLEALNVRWQFQDVPGLQALAHDLEQVARALGQRQSALREARERDLQRASLQATGPVGASLVPTSIADACWQPLPSAVLYDTGPGLPAVLDGEPAVEQDPPAPPFGIPSNNARSTQAATPS